MYETPANTGAWCFFYMHSLHSCCEMSAASEMQKRFSSGRFVVPELASHAGERCLRIIKSVGSRAKNLNYLVAPSLWVVSRYFKDNPTMISVDADFETVWGWKACEISETWRKHNEARKLEAGQSQKRIAAGGSSSQAIGRHLTELKSRGPSATRSTIVPIDDTDPRQPSSSSRYRPDDSDGRSLPSLKAVGLLDSFEIRRTNTETRAMLPPLSKAREW